MMTALFDFADHGSRDIPVDLVAAGLRGVSPLEFFVLEDEASATLAREQEEREAERGQEASAEFVASERARQTQAMVDAARHEAAAETRAAMLVELEARLVVERERIDAVCGQFAMDRQRYFGAAEVQVVNLALAMARRVLAREVEGDAMHLTAVVRAALARVQDGTDTVLRVPEVDAERWAATLGMAREGGVTVVGDERLAAGECVLETDIGRVELGVKVQLEEIERGFGEMMRRQGG